MTYRKTDDEPVMVSDMNLSRDINMMPGEARYVAESKSDRFIRLAEARTNKAIYYLDKLASLSTRSKGAYTPEQVDAIIAAIADALNKTEQKLLGTEPKLQPFTLKGE